MLEDVCTTQSHTVHIDWNQAEGWLRDTVAQGSYQANLDVFAQGKKNKYKTDLQEDFWMVLFKDIVSSLLHVHAMLVFDGMFRAQSILCGAQQYTDMQCFDVFCWKRPSVL